MATTNGTPQAASSILDEISSKAPAGTVLPPRNIRDIVEKTAGYVARNGAAFEEKIRSNQGSKSNMSFLNPEDAYNAYYRWRVDEIKAGRGTSIAAGRKEGEVSFQGREERKGPEKPEEFMFSARMPNISAKDLEIVKLTALFVAKNGRSWMTSLSQREGANFQFDFLRPQHSLYQFFSRLVDQYTDLLTGDSVDGGAPQRKRIAELEANVKDRFRILERAKKRAEWAQYQEAQKVAKEEQEEKERITYAQIDWHDFVVVETVVFDERDENAELPAPTSLNDLQSASLEQKASMRVDANRRIEEAMPTFDDYEQFYGQPEPVQQPQQQQQMPSPVQSAQRASPAQPTPPPAQAQPFQPPPPTSNDRLTDLQASHDRARLVQDTARASATNPTAPVKIRKDYIPAAQARSRAQQNTSICPNCKQAIPNDEMAEHMRIELLDPNWREQFRKGQERSATTNLSTDEVGRNLKRLASQRGDVFESYDGGVGKRVEVATPEPQVPLQNGNGSGQVQQAGGQGEGKPPDVQEQIRQIHERARNG